MKTKDDLIKTYGNPTITIKYDDHFIARSYKEDCYLMRGLGLSCLSHKFDEDLEWKLIKEGYSDERLEWILADNKYKVAYLKNNKILKMF
jgi:hypothetical protein